MNIETKVETGVETNIETNIETNVETNVEMLLLVQLWYQSQDVQCVVSSIHYHFAQYPPVKQIN